MVAGRPRTTCPDKDELIKLGEEMVKWVILHQPIHLSHWYCREKMIVYNQWKQMISKPEFHPYYEKALSIVSEKYIDGTIPPAIASRFIRGYFKHVKEEEDEKANESLDKEYERKKKLIEHEYKIKVEAEQRKSVAPNDDVLKSILDGLKGLKNSS